MRLIVGWISVIRPIRIIVTLLGRFGLAARGSVFMVGGTLLVFAAIHVNPKEARGLEGTLRKIESQPYGHLLLACVRMGEDGSADAGLSRPDGIRLILENFSKEYPDPPPPRSEKIHRRLISSG